MATTALRPDSTVSNSGTVTGGGGDADAVLADDTDVTYITFFQWENATFGLEDFTLPAGAVVKQVTLRARVARVSSNKPVLTCRLTIDGDEHTGAAVVNWSSPATIALAVVTESFSDSAVDAATINLGALVASLRVYEAYLDVVYVAKPTVDSVIVGDGSATITDDDTPLIAWTAPLDSDGGPQTGYEVKVMADGDDPDVDDAVAESGELTGSATSWQMDDPLADATYDVYVRVKQTVNGSAHWSEWSSAEEFTLNIDAPGTPTLTATADDANARIALVLDATSGDATTDYFEVQASYDGGTTWQALRTVDGDGYIDADTNGEATAYDFEAPNGTEATYRARAHHEFISGTTSTSDWSTTDTATWESTSWWLKSATDPDLNITVTPRSQPGRSRQPRQSVNEVLGRDDPVVISDGPGHWQGELVLISEDDDARDALDALLDEAAPILVQAPAAVNDWEDRWIMVTNFDRQRVVDASWVAPSFDTLSWIEVKRPTVNLTAWPS